MKRTRSGDERRPQLRRRRYDDGGDDDSQRCGRRGRHLGAAAGAGRGRGVRPQGDEEEGLEALQPDLLRREGAETEVRIHFIEIETLRLLKEDFPSGIFSVKSIHMIGVIW